MKKRVLSLLVTLVMVIGLLPSAAWASDLTAAEEPAQIAPLAAEETVTGEIKVGTAAELAALGGKTVEGNITLTHDIDLSDTAMTPITSLKGCFNGDGHTISGLTLTGGKGTFSSRVNTGLIGELNGSVINVKMTGVNITGIDQYNNVGALAGKIADNSTSTIDNCTVSGTITGAAGNGNTLAGALVGMMSGSNDAPTTLTIHNCVANVALKGASSTYVGGLLGSAQYYSNVTITKCAQLGSLSGSGNSGGMIGYINSASTALTLSDSYLGGKVDGSKKYGISYNTSALTTLSCTNFYYDNTKNSGSYFDMLYRGYDAVTGKVTAKSTAELKALTIEGFEVRDGEFDGYPVPVWTPAAAPEPIKPPFSCALTFTGVEGGTLTVKHGENTLTANVDGSYTLTEAGEYSYSVAFGEDSPYNNVAETTFTVGENDTEKTIAVTLTYKTTDPSGEGTKEDPILIGTAAELRAFADKVNDGDTTARHAYVKLKNDIVVPGSWTPIGKTATFPFSGHFNGDGHSVTITVDSPNLTYYGFFGCLDSEYDRDSSVPVEDQPTVVVENLTIDGTIYCSEPYTFVGGLAGRARGKVEIRNCTNNANVSSLARGSAGVGGLIGGYDDGADYVYKNIRMTVDGCTNTGLVNVTGDNTDAKVGGLVGSNQNCVQVKDSQNTGTVNAPGCTVGGLLGEAGSQTGDFKPSISDSSNTGTLIGAPGKTNNLYGKGTISSDNVTNSGDNTYIGGSESEDELLKESKKYGDVLAVPSTANAGDEVTLLKSSETADETITVACSIGERDTNRAYLQVVNGKLQLAKKNDTGKIIEATATITWTKGGKSLSKPVTVNIYPASTGETSARRALMDTIAGTYVENSGDWVVFDMAAYALVNGTTTRTSDAAKTNCLNLMINDMAGDSAIPSDRAKAEIIFAALGIDSTLLTPYYGLPYSNAGKLETMNLSSSYYSAPWVLLAEQAGKVNLTDAQRNSMIKLLTDNLGPDGLFVTKWGLSTFDDPDTTGSALAALAQYNTAEYPAVQDFITKAVAGLSKAQRDNGSYGNANSDAMVITGLAALGIDPGSDPRFVKNGCSLADALLLYVNDGGNGFTTGYISGEQGEKAQALATEQGFRALVTLELFGKDTTKAFNIYTLTSYTSAGVPDPDQPEKPDPTPGGATGEGTLPSTPDDGGSTGGETSEWISVSMTIKPDNATAWYSGSVRVAKGATVEQVIRAAADNAGLVLDIKDGYLRAITYNGVKLGQYDQGANSGWFYKVNGAYKMVGIADCVVSSGDSVELCYTSDYTKEDLGGHFSGGTTGEEETAKLPFVDVKEGDWFYEAVRYAYEKNLINGTSATTFAPGETLSRAMAVTILHRLAGTPAASGNNTFSDVQSGLWYTDAIDWAAGAKIVDGMGGGIFAPDGSITREQMAVILYRYAKAMNLTQTGKADLSAYTDAADVSDWAVEAMQWAVANGLINGMTNATLAPGNTATRAQFAAVMQRFCTLTEQK